MASTPKVAEEKKEILKKEKEEETTEEFQERELARLRGECSQIGLDIDSEILAAAEYLKTRADKAFTLKIFSAQEETEEFQGEKEETEGETEFLATE